MLVNTITSSNCTPQTIVIGRRGTYDTMQIVFDLTYLVENYGSGTAVLAIKRSQDESAYPAVAVQENNMLTWTVSETDTYYVGSGECQLMWYVDGGLAKTIIYPMVVMRDILATSEEAPDAYQTWVDNLTALGAETLQNAQNAAQSASEAENAKDDAVDAKEAAEEAAETAQEAVVHAPIIQNGYWYIWNDGQYVDTGVRAEGQKGDKGDTGEKGDTGNGIASITKTGTSGLVDTYTVTYTDGTTTTFTVTNGAKGDKGDTGATGNGIQSITKTGTSGNVDTYTITYTNGQTVTFTVTNGAVSSVAGKTGAVVLDAGDIGYDSTATYTSGTVGAELGDLTRHLSDISSPSQNIFNDSMISGTGITRSGHSFSGTARSIFNAFGTAATAIPVSAEANIVYQLTFNAFCATSGTGNGLSIQFLYTDNTTAYAVVIPNSTTTATAFSASTDSAKTLAGLIFVYGTGQSNVWTISDIMLTAGGESSFVPYLTAFDRVARNDFAHTKSILTTIPGKNIFDPSGHVDGYLNPDGSIHTNPSGKSWKTTEFIPVSDYNYITFSAYVISQSKRSSIAMYYLTTYNASKTLLSQYASDYKTYPVESGVAYVRFSYGGTAGTYTDYQLEANNTYTGYQPFTTFNALDNSLYQTWHDKLWCCVGDSLTEQNSRTDKHYYDYVYDKTGIGVYVMGVGGTGYIRGAGDNNAFYQRISAVPTNADVITIFGSLNDLGSGAELGTADDTGTTTIGGCINTTLDNLFTVIPLANVGIVSPTPWNAEQYDTIHAPNMASNYCDLLEAICIKRSIPYLDLFHESLLRPWDATFRTLAYSKDEGSGTHPDENGHKLIAPRFKGFLDTLII